MHYPAFVMGIIFISISLNRLKCSIESWTLNQGTKTTLRLGRLDCGEASFDYAGDITIIMNIGTAKFSLNQEEKNLEALPYALINRPCMIKAPVGPEIQSSYPKLYMHEFQPFIHGWSMDSKTRKIDLVADGKVLGWARRTSEAVFAYEPRPGNSRPRCGEAWGSLSYASFRTLGLHQATPYADRVEIPERFRNLPIFIWKSHYSPEYEEAMRVKFQANNLGKPTWTGQSQLKGLFRPRDITPIFQVNFEGEGPRFYQ